MTERLPNPKTVEQQEQQHAERNRSAVRRGLQVTSDRPMLQPPDFRSSPVHIVLDETDFRCLVAGGEVEVDPLPGMPIRILLADIGFARMLAAVRATEG